MTLLRFFSPLPAPYAYSGCSRPAACIRTGNSCQQVQVIRYARALARGWAFLADDCPDRRFRSRGTCLDYQASSFQCRALSRAAESFSIVQTSTCQSNTRLRSFPHRTFHPRLDFGAHDGSGRPLEQLTAHFRIDSEWPPCTNWTGPEGRYAKPVQWADFSEALLEESGASESTTNRIRCSRNCTRTLHRNRAGRLSRPPPRCSTGSSYLPARPRRSVPLGRASFRSQRTHAPPGFRSCVTLQRAHGLPPSRTGS